MKKILIVLNNYPIERKIFVEQSEIKHGWPGFSQWSRKFEKDEECRKTLSESFYKDGDITFAENFPEGKFYYYDAESCDTESVTSEDFDIEQSFWCYWDGSNQRAVEIYESEELDIEEIYKWSEPKSRSILWKAKNRYFLEVWSLYDGDDSNVIELEQSEIKQMQEDKCFFIYDDYENKEYKLD